jgi:glycosyltransferase involved in cell wall biosynthesis
MRIGINATCINERPSGARQRFVGLLSQLARMMPDSEFVIFEPVDCRVGSWFAGAPNVTARRTPLHSGRRLQRYLRGLQYWRKVFAGERFDLFESLHMPAIRAPRAKALLTIHDVRGLYPGNRWWARKLFARVLRMSLRSADQVVTVSYAMRDEILAFSDARPVAVVWNGLDAAGFGGIGLQVREQVRARLRLPAHFLLTVGHFEPRKNYGTLVDALALLHRDGMQWPLVIVGNDSGERMRIEQQVQLAGLRSSVHLLSGLSDSDVRCLYSAASMLVFPSRYEGFGIPLLEAMASGTPVVASDIPVFHEILGDAAVYFDPESALAMASAIREVMATPGLREHMVAYGLARVRNFDYEVLAREMAALYRAVAGRAA